MISINQSKSTAVMTDKSNQPSVVETVVNTIMGVRTEDAQQPTVEGSRVDWSASITYIVGTLVQIGFMLLSLWGLQQISQSVSGNVSVGIAISFFTLVAIRSRLFSPLNNARTRTTYSRVERPSWAPPPLAFPIIWMSIGVLRVVASYLVWQALGQTYFSWPLAILMIHLSLGDTWNTIFTVEGRLGAAVPVVLVGPLASSIVVAVTYWQVVPLAGQLLLPMIVWLGIASTLVVSIWQLNGTEPWYPLKLEKMKIQSDNDR
ncbi:MAG: tryptophan-rich sensory protein [Cyanobacteria bacterium P01_F01_bin.116]